MSAPSQLMQALGLQIAVFRKYAGKEGDAKTLSKGELKDLLTSELGPMIGKCTDKNALDKIFKDLDHNADGVVDFTEFATLCACIATVCHDNL